MITKIYKDHLLQLQADGVVSVRCHPHCPLSIVNYTEKVQFDNLWTDELMEFRGMIFDSLGGVVSRPFKKFFNYGDPIISGKVPDGRFDVFEKLDGSLGISYPFCGQTHIATRGSFDSPQAHRATEILHVKYSQVSLDPSITYLFEIIYPENRIVVDYGERVDLVLIGMIDTLTGQEYPIEDIGFPVPKKYDGLRDLGQVCAVQESNREGFVIRYANGFRMKIKFEEYKRLHKLLTGITARHLWEMLRGGTPLLLNIGAVPDEYHQWVKETEMSILSAYAIIEDQCEFDFSGILDRGAQRKLLAEYIKLCQYPSVLFKMLDGKDYSDIIWKAIKPDPSRPFRCARE